MENIKKLKGDERGVDRQKKGGREREMVKSVAGQDGKVDSNRL